MSVPVVLAAPGLPGESDLVAAFARPGAEVTVVRRCVDAIDLIGAAASGCVHAAVVSPTLPRLARETIERLHACRIGVLGVVEAGDDSGERTLLDLQVDRVVAIAPGDLDHAIGQLARAIHDTGYDTGTSMPSHIDELDAVGEVARGDAGRSLSFSSEEGAGRGSLVVVWGAHGAPGATSVSICLTDEIARSGEASILVDADTMGGSTAMTLGILDEASGLAVSCRHADAGTLDAFTLSQAARSLTEGWRIVTGISRSERWIELRPASLSRLWQVCRDVPGIAVVDVGSGIEAPEGGRPGAGDRFVAAHTAIERADAIVAVGSADPVGIDRLINGLDVLRRRSEMAPVVVINRVRRGVLGRDPVGDIKEALARHARVTDPIFIDDDRPAFDAAVREGRTLADIAPRSKARMALRDLARRITADLGSTLAP